MIPLQASAIAAIVGGTFHGQDLLVTEPPVLNSADAVPGSLFLAFKARRLPETTLLSMMLRELWGHLPITFAKS
jgi:UDP-N-acetylmuramyl pentapeptide synthase